MKEIKIIANTANTKDGRTFTVYKAVQKNGVLMDCKFTKAVGSIPDRFHSVTVDEANINVDRKRQYPVLWIKKVEAFNEGTVLERKNEADELF